MKTKISKKTPKVNIKEIFQEYMVNDDIFCDDETNAIKQVIWNVLDETERRLILVYAELGSMRDTAVQFGCSPSLICKYVGEIREKIKDNLIYD